jgi:hypothetical protein
MQYQSGMQIFSPHIMLNKQTKQIGLLWTRCVKKIKNNKEEEEEEEENKGGRIRI